MSNALSLQASIRTCKVDQGWANKIESDRFFNPNVMMCPVWSGRDLTGRKVCPDSFYTKREGCNSADDRITVENSLRPQYSEYVTLDTSGIRGNFDAGVGNVESFDIFDMTRQGKTPSQTLNQSYSKTGNFGLQFGSSVYPGCGNYGYERGMSMDAQARRGKQFLNEGYKSNCSKCRSGF